MFLKKRLVSARKKEEGIWAEEVEAFINLNYFLSTCNTLSLMPGAGDSAVGRAPALLELLFWVGERRHVMLGQRGPGGCAGRPLRPPR